MSGGDAETRGRGGAEEQRSGGEVETRNQKPETRNQKPKSRNSEPGTRKRPLAPADIVTITYLTVVVVLVLLTLERVTYWLPIVGAHLLTIALVILLALWERRSTIAGSSSPTPPLLCSSAPPRPRVSPSLLISRFIHGWYPVAVITASFKELTYLVPLIHPRDFDVELAALDYQIFGVHPTVWLERLTWPPLTDILQLVYASYYLFPVVLGAVLWSKGWFDKFNFWVCTLSVGFFLSFLGYIAVPAIGPRFLQSIVDAQTKPLEGVFLFQTIREMLDRAEGITRDCFPSGHVEITLLVLYFARRFHRPTFWCLLPFGTALVVSTVYLRYHYVVDVVAGALCAVLVIAVARRLYKRLGGDLSSE